MGAVYLAAPNNFYLDVAIQIGLNAMVVVGLNLLIGYAGQITASATPVSSDWGAYASAVCRPSSASRRWPRRWSACWAVGLLAFAWRGDPAPEGHYLAMATLGLGILVYMVLTNESQPHRRAGRHGGGEAAAVRRADQRQGLVVPDHQRDAAAFGLADPQT